MEKAYSDFFAFVVSSSGQGDAYGPGAELSMQDDDHDFVRRGSRLLQGLVGLVYQALQLLKVRIKYLI